MAMIKERQNYVRSWLKERNMVEFKSGEMIGKKD